MIKFEDGSGLVTVMVIVDTGDEDKQELLELARSNQEFFAGHEGFRGAALLESTGSPRFVQVLQWASEEDHQACMAHPAWSKREESRRFLELMGSGSIVVDPQVYRVVAVEDAD